MKARSPRSLAVYVTGSSLLLAACSSTPSSGADAGTGGTIPDASVDTGSNREDGATSDSAVAQDGPAAPQDGATMTEASLPEGSLPPDASTGSPHVMVLNMENQSITDILGNSAAPYQNSLASQYQKFTQSFGVGHYSLDNYLAQISGKFYSASDGDCDPGDRAHSAIRPWHPNSTPPAFPGLRSWVR